MIAKLLEGICLCTSFYLFKEFEEYKHGQDFVYKGTSTDRVNNGYSRHIIVITGCRITPTIGKKSFGGLRISGVMARAMMALVEYACVQMLLTQLLVKMTLTYYIVW